MTRRPKIEIYRSFNHRGARCMTPCDNPKHLEYRWRMRASNGKIISESGEGYIEPRNLVRGLELSHPHFELTRDWDELDPESGWYLCDYFTGGPHVPVTVPEGTDHLWHARRLR